MFHALLSNKLGEDTPAPERFEDALTSSVFGTLLLLGASDILSEWLRSSRDVDGTVGEYSRPSGAPAYWFWPRLGDAEPDIIIRMGRQIYIVEAKYRSRLHDVRPADTMFHPHLETDQLCRQWSRMTDLRYGRAYGPPDLCTAARQCEASFVLLVDQRSLGWAQRALRKVHRSLPHRSDVRVLTWQDLHRVLAIRIRRGVGARWMEELNRYLARVDLDGFAGIHMHNTAPAAVRLLLGWSETRSSGMNLSEAAPRLASTYDQSVAIRTWSRTTLLKESTGIDGIVRRLKTSRSREHAVAVAQWRRRLAEKTYG